MSDFIRFPHTPHLAWLAAGSPRDDKVLSPVEAHALLGADVVIEEKLDGANLGFSLDEAGALRAQNRGQYLTEPHTGQFARLPAWLAQHGPTLQATLKPGLIVFGEWCAARHSLHYDHLPDWFLVFDVYDREAGRFWSTGRRAALAHELGLLQVPRVDHGRYTLDALKDRLMAAHSHYRHGELEGLVIRRESADWCDARAKLVRPDFTQTIAEHWRRRLIEWNRIQPGHTPPDRP